MAASAYSIILTNGQTISVYQAANQAVNSNPVVNMNGVATAGMTTTDFTVSSSACVDDIIVPATLTAGGIEFYNVTRGIRSGKGYFNLETFTAANTTRHPARICLVPGYTYRFIQVIAGNA